MDEKIQSNSNMVFVLGFITVVFILCSIAYVTTSVEKPLDEVASEIESLNTIIEKQQLRIEQNESEIENLNNIVDHLEQNSR